MIHFIKHNKVFSFLLIITIICFIGSIFLTSVIDDNTKKEIHNNVISILSSKNIQKKMLTKDNFFITFYMNTFTIILIWLLGISIIGIPIILFFYLIKVLLLAWNIFFLFNHFTLSNSMFIFLYLSSSIFFILILFLLCYYAISYSIILIKLLFRKNNFSIKIITKRYIKILLIMIILSLIISLFEVYVLPKIIIFL